MDFLIPLPLKYIVANMLELTHVNKVCIYMYMYKQGSLIILKT